MPCSPHFFDLMRCWGVDAVSECPELAVPGSPERCLERHVLRDGRQGLWLLERLGAAERERYEAVARLLALLRARGVPGVVAYRQRGEGDFLVERDGSAWRLSSFVPGDVLERPAYALDSERGAALATFLCALRRAGDGVEDPELGERFFLAAYGRELVGAVRVYRLGMAGAVENVLAELAPFFEIEPQLDGALCHGDVHPLNVIWSSTRILAVIDWEFVGPKAALYDAANCLGCVGSEGPDAFGAGLCRTLVRDLRQGGGLSDDEAGWLVPAMAATRLGWLSEWLRRSDEQMIAFELGYLDYLIENRSTVERDLGL